jgi:hypothetical protein
VSFVEIPSKIVMISLKTPLINFLWNFLYTFPYSYMCLLEPTVIANGWLFILTIYYNLDHTLSISENVVAPSASTISTLYPCDIAIPARTAPPFPLFLGYSTTTNWAPNYLAFFNATYVVLSFDPSFAIII